MTALSTIELSIPGGSQQWPDRIERACQVLEGAIAPSDRLLWSRSQKDGVADKQLTTRDTVLRKLVGTSARWFSFHDGRDSHISRTGKVADHGHVALGGRFNDLKKRCYSLSASFPQTVDVESLILDLGDQSDAICAQHSPDAAHIQLRAGQLMSNWDYALEQGASDLVKTLPALAWSAHGALLDSPYQPESLGWLNYWSKATCDWLGFPDPSLDATLLNLSCRSRRGAWIMKLTAEPLDLGREDHVTALAKAYIRFPKLGIRRGGSRGQADEEPNAPRGPGDSAFAR